MKVLFLILNYKTWEDTAKLCKEIIAERIEDFSILVVDNASPNDSYQKLLYIACEDITVIKSDVNGGYAKGNNYGLRYAKKYNPEYVCIINNDVYFHKDVIDSLIENMKHLPDVGMIAPVQKLPGDIVANFPQLKVNTFGDDIKSYLFKPNKTEHKYESNTEYQNLQQVEILPGAFLFADYKVLESVDFFDEATFLFCEERFMKKRLDTIGKHNYVLLDSFYIHEHSKTINSTASIRMQNKFLFDSRMKFTMKYRKLPLLCAFLLKMAYSLYNTRLWLKELKDNRNQ